MPKSTYLLFRKYCYESETIYSAAVFASIEPRRTGLGACQTAGFAATRPASPSADMPLYDIAS